MLPEVVPWMTLCLAFFAPLVWHLHRPSSLVLLALTGVGTALCLLLPSAVRLNVATLLVALLSGYASGFPLNLLRRASVPSAPVAPSARPQQDGLAWARALGGFLFLGFGLSFCFALGQGNADAVTVAFAVLQLAAGVFFLPGALLVRVGAAGLLAVVATILGTALPAPA
ncbi:hypothetical protein [Deinococcus soli (ex Cha et al. 2016)]|uniref:Uncharacterized membrane-anchored protein YitT (DUF2179 family) n=2 Tax=Deinococcus soli (ex Cha et al. 2016) TaxID=1309411 RepID=A0ACC6KCS6_9DEIO|nr:hypothetical protein [Deinococcus soli (ex Cha et al. 2016)]MDR6217716.1 uncharacterized membrane-anchored protein YitT (DUF2179 family) [Deinococcus soli (ex Cha et al. 2016)]MDR6327025.1 uncharacterized membrane-anchored protein YitT (DUF2179 family) [Deinococcus soli (ex Cha et al. 2016)]MDR6750249.1 uncharacterized membrane-anchored protein YitT (DUF2179 family) [Deinococcus soli (ex Cha et al. 2016)]